MEEFNGGNIKKFARTSGISERAIYKLVKDTIKAASIKPMEGQMSLLDDEK